MANQTKAQLEARVAELEAQLAAKPDVKALADKDAQIAKLRAGMDANKFVPQPIKGTFEVEIKAGANKKVKKTFKWKDGHLAIRVPGDLGIPVATSTRLSTEGIMELAQNGKISDKYVEMSPAIKSMNQEDAKWLLQHFAAMQYGGLIEVK